MLFQKTHLVATILGLSMNIVEHPTVHFIKCKFGKCFRIQINIENGWCGWCWWESVLLMYGLAFVYMQDQNIFRLLYKMWPEQKHQLGGQLSEIAMNKCINDFKWSSRCNSYQFVYLHSQRYYALSIPKSYVMIDYSSQ